VLSGFLNALYGAGLEGGQLFNMSTKHIERLDNIHILLFTPGRVDQKIPFQLFHRSMINQLSRLALPKPHSSMVHVSSSLSPPFLSELQTKPSAQTSSAKQNINFQESTFQKGNYSGVSCNEV